MMTENSDSDYDGSGDSSTRRWLVLLDDVRTPDADAPRLTPDIRLRNALSILNRELTRRDDPLQVCSIETTQFLFSVYRSTSVA